MSIKDYPTDELLAELSTRVRPDSPLYDPQELRDMLIKSESECSELRAQVERKETRIKVLEVANDSLTQYSSNLTAERDTLRHELQAERDTSNQRLTEIYDRARKAEKERDALQARIDAGVRVWGDKCAWGDLDEYDTHTGIVIDVEEINHDVVKRAAQHLIERAEKFSMAELHKADMAGVVGLSLAYLDLAAQLEAERDRVDRLAELVESAFLIAHDFGGFDARNNIHVTKETHWSVSEIRDELATIMEDRDNG